MGRVAPQKVAPGFIGLVVILLSLSCEERRAPSAPEPTGEGPEVVAPPDVRPAEPAELRELWRIPGELLGVTERHAIVLDPRIVAVDLQTGTVTVTAETSAEDPTPSFERHLPRFGEPDSDLREVDRLTDAPVYLDPDANVVTYLRGYDDVVTSLVGLDADTFQTRWVHPLAFRQPIQTCAAPTGIFLLPPPPAPARFVNWNGEQKWQREVTSSKAKVERFACRDDAVLIITRDAKHHRITTFALSSGDLLETREAKADDELAKASVPPPTPTSSKDEPRVVQTDDEVVSFGF